MTEQKASLREVLWHRHIKDQIHAIVMADDKKPWLAWRRKCGRDLRFFTQIIRPGVRDYIKPDVVVGK